MPFYPTDRRSSFRTRVFKSLMNLWPVYRGTGGWISFISADWHEIQVQLPLNIFTRNYVGTIFGGSIYSSIDPVYMLMLMKILGKGYIVWDKAATIKFKKPGQSRLYTRFLLDEATISEIITAADNARSIDRSFTVQLHDKHGTLCAEIEKVIYIRKKGA